jgi:hypothetical protein
MEMNRESIPTESADTMPLEAMLLVEIDEGQLGADLEVLNERSAADASPPQARPDPMYHAAILALACGVLVLAVVLSVRNSTEVLLPVFGVPLPELCMSKRYLGFDCPGCGLTRCFISLARGDLAAAWQYNPAGLWLFGMLAAQIPFRSLQLLRIRRGLPELTTGSLAQWLFGILGVLLVGQWLLRLVGIPF